MRERAIFNGRFGRAIVRLAWIASEVGSATGFPKGNIIPEKSRPDEGRECWCREGWLEVAYSIGPSPRRHPCRTAECLPNCSTPGLSAPRKAFSAAQLVRHEYSLAFAPPALDGTAHSIEVRVSLSQDSALNAPVPPYRPFRPGRNLRSWGF